MSSGGLVLPGERRRVEFRPSRALAAGVAGTLWLPVQATLLPQLGIGDLPLDPLLPLVAAFALGGRWMEAWVLALGLGFVADSFTGIASGRLVLQYAFVVCIAAPMHGRVVLRDRAVPVFGVFILSFSSGLAVLLVLGLMGAAQHDEVLRLPIEAMGTAAAAAMLWPLYRRIAGWQDERSMTLGGRR